MHASERDIYKYIVAIRPVHTERSSRTLTVYRLTRRHPGSFIAIAMSSILCLLSSYYIPTITVLSAIAFIYTYHDHAFLTTLAY